MESLKKEARRIRLRVTKNVGGKRIPLTGKELKLKIQRRRNAILETQFKDAKNLIRKCKSIYRIMGVNAPCTLQKNPVKRTVPVPPPPPRKNAPRIPIAHPPPPTKKRDIRTNLITNLKANLKRRGIKQKLNQIS